MNTSIKRMSLAALTAAALTACGGGGGSVAGSGQVELNVTPDGTVTLSAGNTLRLSSSAKAFFSALKSHGWTVRQVSGVPSEGLVTVSDATCKNATVTPGYQSSGSTPGRNGTSDCPVVLTADLSTPASEWEISSTATSGSGSASDRFVLKITPSAQANSGFTLAVPNLPLTAITEELVTVSASTSVNDGVRPDKPATYQWSLLSGPAATLAGANTSTVAFVPKEAGDYVLGVKTTVVINGKTETREGAVVVLVKAKTAPVQLSVNAGALQAAKVGEAATLSGTVSGSTNATVRWTQVSGPQTVAVFNDEQLQAQFTPTKSGDYVFELTATHPGTPAVTKSARTKVSAYEPVTGTPFFAVSAGDAQVGAVNQIVSLTATVKAGEPAPGNLLYQWTQVSGPTVSLAGPTGLAASFVPKTTGTYEFEFKATTAQAPVVSNTDRTVVHVLADAPKPFGVDAGSIQVAPTGVSVKLQGSLQGSDTSNVNVRWVQTGGPGVTLFGQNTLQAEFLPTQAGEYQFELRGYRADNETDARSDTTMVAVYSTYDSPVTPVFAVSAGDAQVVGPDAPVVLTGEVAQGTPAPDNMTYQWSQISGPAVTLSNDKTIRASFIAPEPNLYTFLLTVSAGGVTKTAVTSVQVLAVPPVTTP